MNTVSITLPRQTIQTVLDSITRDVEGRDCTLFFPPTPQPISSGQSINPAFGSDISNNVWAGGSPLPLNNIQNNTYEGGSNYVEIETTGVIRMVIYPNPTKFNNVFPIGERQPDGLIVTRGFVSDLHSVLNATRMETFSDVAQTHYKYKLDGEPAMPGTLVPSRYFYALWQRV